ncbi:MAG: hypothetical protein OD814_000205 [Candidatus Alkanophagales archaeon MCA70_species_1]|nr:hypothetical protein [Candidatus Alkanophaga volatiphilum]
MSDKGSNNGKNKNLEGIKWVVKFPVDTLQIYFPCSLELQDELIKRGFKVPGDKSRKIKTPIPLIYSNFRGWLVQPEPITIERLIPPEWYGKTAKELGWKETISRGKTAYHLPQEEVWVNIGFDNNGLIHFKLDIRGYHLERTSIRGINPEKWNNWAMFYISAEYLDDLINTIAKFLNVTLARKLYPILEKQQGGKEKTYYASPTRSKSLGIPVINYSLCLGCFDLALLYFKHKSIENNLNPDIVKELKLRITYEPTINAGLKVGIAKIEGKRPQIMFKLASNTPIQIKGILKPIIEGKARGNLCFCNHRSKTQLIIARALDIYSALSVTKQKLKDL